MKKAIVIGASSGIGNELAKILAVNKYEVAITGRREIRNSTRSVEGELKLIFIHRKSSFPKCCI